MNPEVISPFFAIRFFEQNQAEFSNPERKHSQIPSVMTTSAKKVELQIIPENAEVQIMKMAPYCKEDRSHLSNWVYDNNEDLGHYPNDFLRKMDARTNWSESTIEAPLLRQIKQKMILLAVSRILKVEKYSLSRSNSYVKSKLSELITTMVNPSVKKSVIKYITDKIKTRLDLGLEWLHKEYTIYFWYQDNSEFEEKFKDDAITYKTLFCMFSMAILETKEEERGPLMMRLYLKAPLVPDEAVKCWKNIIPDERGLAVIELLRNIIMERPGKLRKFFNILLYYSNHEVSIIRKGAVALCMDFYGNPDYTNVIKDYALLHIEYLRLIVPPPELFNKDQGRDKVETEWTESTIRACLALYIGLVEKQPLFIKELEELFPILHSTVQKLVLKFIRLPLLMFNIETQLLDRSYIEKQLNLY